VVIYRVARSARYIGNDHTLLAEELIDNRAFARVGLAYNGNFYGVIVLLLGFILAGGKLQDLIEYIARARTVNRGNGDGVVKTKLVKLVKSERQIADGVYFVNAEYYRLFASFEYLSDLAVVRGNACIYIAKENDNVRRFDSDLCLKLHLFKYYVIGFRLYTARVYKNDGLAVPFRFVINTVARYARHVIYDGNA
jgi:hypothetical protein